jgi:peptidoglycan hydrolase-like protein with peptidoglycan-binding domain
MNPIPIGRGAVLLGSRGLGAAKAEPNVKTLQNALKGLSKATGNPGIDPGPVDGLVGPKLRNAVSQSMSYISGASSSSAISGIAALFGIAGLLAPAATVDQAIFAQSLTLASAVNIATARYANAPNTGAGAGAGTIPPPAAKVTPWYATWWGAGGLILGGVGAVVLVSSLARPRDRLPAGE